MDDNNSSNSGVLSRFRERIRNIRINKSKKKKVKEDEEKKFIEDKVKEIHRVVDNGPVVRKKGIYVEDNIKEKDVEKVNIRKDNNERVIDNNNIKNDDINNLDNSQEVIDVEKKERNNKVIDDNNIKNDDINNLDNRQDIVDVRENVGSNKIQGDSKELVDNKEIKKDDNNNKESNKDEKINEFRDELLIKIRNSFEDKMDELEVLEGELFLLSLEEENAVVIKEIKELQKKIDRFIKELNELILEYNAYKKNYYMDNIIMIDDSVIVDDLIDYRDMISSMDKEKKFVKDYKNMEEFKSLYNNLTSVKNEVELLKEKTRDKSRDFYERDDKYKRIKEDMVNISKIGLDSVEEVNRQNKYFDGLMDKINKINKEEYVTQHLKGFSDLAFASLKYMGLMMLNPLKGTIPGIGVQVVATKNLIGNLRNNLHWEEVKHVKYSAFNYEHEINDNIFDINYVSSYVDDAIFDIKKIKEDFLLQYDSRIPNYDNTLDSIKKIEHALYRNKNKIDKIRDNLKKSKKINDDKLVRVRELNKNG